DAGGGSHRLLEPQPPGGVAQGRHLRRPAVGPRGLLRLRRRHPAVPRRAGGQGRLPHRRAHLLLPLLRLVTVPAALSFVTVGARDVDRLRRFYVAGLGWTPWASTDDFLAFDLGGTKVGFFAMARLAEEAGSTPPAPGTWSGWTLACNAATRDGVDAL